ncbi:LapA family protein [Mycobacterium tilburgii]|uniref:LapA family protein n=1 Tax=Mycobacterium tilburgii TaxID=44467 RepID=UPI0016425E96|nr:LapA family protein [Mycobacterium tilburgii]
MKHNGRDSVGDRFGGRAEDPPPDSVRTPALLVFGAAVLALGVCIANFALGQVDGGVAAAIVGLMALGAGLDWLGMDRRRIRQAERDRFAGHPTR